MGSNHRPPPCRGSLSDGLQHIQAALDACGEEADELWNLQEPQGVDEPAPLWSRTVRPCWLSQFFDTACYGVRDKCHIGLQKQTLRQAGLTEEEVWDPRVWRRGCRDHHQAFDGPWFRLRREQLPESVEAFAWDHDLVHRLDRDFGPREKEPSGSR